MKAQELRIGNIVTHEDYSSDVFTVKTIELFDGNYVINTSGGKNGTWVNPVDLVNPVPLTEKWLKELGFFDGKLTFTGDDGYVIKGDKFYIGLMKKENGWSFHNPHFDLTIQYVHQLQNLYFSLVGTELTCDPQS